MVKSFNKVKSMNRCHSTDIWFLMHGFWFRRVGELYLCNIICGGSPITKEVRDSTARSDYLYSN